MIVDQLNDVETEAEGHIAVGNGVVFSQKKIGRSRKKDR